MGLHFFVEFHFPQHQKPLLQPRLMERIFDETDCQLTQCHHQRCRYQQSIGKRNQQGNEQIFMLYDPLYGICCEIVHPLPHQIFRNNCLEKQCQQKSNRDKYKNLNHIPDQSGEFFYYSGGKSIRGWKVKEKGVLYMTTAQALILLAIAIYLLFMLWIGWICAKKNESVDDFYLGGRKLGPFVTAMSAEASDMSSWLLMGLPGVAYLTGLAEASWTAIGLIVGTYLNWLIVARRIRRYSNRLNAITVPQFFSKR